MEIHHIMVVGAGQMGGGIAQVAAHAGLEVTLCDLDLAQAGRGLEVIRGHLERGVEKGNLSHEEKEAVLSRIRLSDSLEDAGKAAFVIEAASESMEVKSAIFKTLDKAAPKEVILATNTSSLSITALGAATQSPHRVIGMHFMNPVPLMPLIEIIRGLLTDDEVFKTVEELALQLGKTPVLVQDSPGFVSNRVLMPMINEAVCCVYEGVAEPAAVDEVMTLGMNHPMGPLALADLIGLDTVLAIMEVLYRDFSDSKYRPCPLLRKMVRGGLLGRKSGQGFYSYR